MKYAYSLVWIFLFSAISIFQTKAYAQTPTGFSADSLKFLDEVDDYFSNVKGKEKEGHAFIKEEFKPFWFGGNLSDEKRNFVYATCNALIKKKLRPYPDYYNFFSALINFYKSDLEDASFASWKASTEKLIGSSSSKKLSDFLDVSNALFGSNKLYQSNSVEWFTNNNKYAFEFDSLPKIIFSNTNLFCAVKGDTATITGTSGTFYPTEKKWIGKGGKVCLLYKSPSPRD